MMRMRARGLRWPNEKLVITCGENYESSASRIAQQVIKTSNLP